MTTNILLLRGPGGSPDKYEAAFSGNKYAPVSIPVLETVLTNVSQLSKLIRTESARFAGIVITSARACEALGKAFDGDFPSWKSTFYVVGKGTAAALRQVFPDADIRGEDSGNAVPLGRFILDDLGTSLNRNLLYLTGDKNRDTLPSILTPSFTLTSLQVYKTTGSPEFPHQLEALKSTGKWWIVFFAPSAADFVWPYLQAHFQTELMSIAAIGPTTADFLTAKLGLHVHVTALKPTSQDLVEAIVEFENNGHRHEHV